MTRHESGRQLLYPETCLNDSLGRLAWGEGYVNPIWPSLFWCIRDPLDIFWLGGVKVRILFGKDGVIYHIQKDSYALVRVFALIYAIT